MTIEEKAEIFYNESISDPHKPFFWELEDEVKDLWIEEIFNLEREKYA